MNITERGWAGHFIFSDECKFRRNTLIEHDEQKFIVSTVGNRWSEGSIEPKEIGVDNYYETMVFHAGKIDNYIDVIDYEEIIMEGKSKITEMHIEADNEANVMHEDIVNEVVDKLLEGTMPVKPFKVEKPYFIIQIDKRGEYNPMLSIGKIDMIEIAKYATKEEAEEACAECIKRDVNNKYVVISVEDN